MCAYQTIKCVGYIAYCDGLIAKKLPNGKYEAFLISLIGSPSHIQASSAMLFKNELCKIINDDDSSDMKFTTGTVRTIRNRKIDNTVNKVMVTTEYFINPTGFAVVFGPNSSIVHKRAFNCLDAATSVPLKPEWQEWLWDELMQPEQLLSFGNDDLQDAYIISLPRDATLEERVLEAIRLGYLT